MPCSFIRALLGLCLSCILPLTACGGGSGGDDADEGVPPPFQGGFYQVVAAGGTTESGFDEFVTRWGGITPGGGGLITGSIASNRNGVLTAPESILGQTYALTPDGTLDVLGPFTGRGRVSGSGSIAGLSLEGGEPGVFFLLRRPLTPMSNATLNGAFQLARFTVGAQHVSTWGDVALDGFGNLSASNLRENAEGVTAPAAPFSGTYNVAATGAVSVSVDGSQYTGAVVEDGALTMVCGGDALGDTPAIWLLTRRAVSANNATLDGTYAIVGIEYSLGSAHYRSSEGILTADGAGSYDVTLTTNDNGVLLPTTPSSGAFGVFADGTLALTPAGGVTLIGAVTGDGRYAFLAGPDASTFGPVFYLLVRRG